MDTLDGANNGAAFLRPGWPFDLGHAWTGKWRRKVGQIALPSRQILPRGSSLAPPAMVVPGRGKDGGSARRSQWV